VTNYYSSKIQEDTTMKTCTIFTTLTALFCLLATSACAAQTIAVPVSTQKTINVPYEVRDTKKLSGKDATIDTTTSLVCYQGRWEVVRAGFQGRQPSTTWSQAALFIAKIGFQHSLWHKPCLGQEWNVADYFNSEGRERKVFHAEHNMM
jgi:hypothetical protein